MTSDTDYTIKEVLQEFRRENKDDHDIIRAELKGIAREAEIVDDKTEKAHSKLGLQWKVGALIAVAYCAWLAWLTVQVVEHVKVKQ